MNLTEKYIGNWGRYQALTYAILFVPGLISGSQTLLFVFTGAVPKHRCFVPTIDNVTTPVSASPAKPMPFNSNFFGLYKKQIYGESELEGGKETYCQYCPLSSFQSLQNARALNSTCSERQQTSCDHGHVYDRSQYRTSLVMTYDMVCPEKSWMKELSKSMFMVGKLLGAFLIGVLSDRFGRRPVFMFCGITAVITLNVFPFLPNFPLIAIFLIINGMVAYGAFLTSFIITMELIGGIYRTVCGIWIQGYFCAGYIYVGVLAYFIREWKTLHWAVSAPAILLLPCCWLLPESVRWLIVKGRTDQAKQILIRAAKINGKTINEREIQADLDYHRFETKDEKQGSLADLFRHKQLAICTIIVFLTWASVSMAYYGLSLNTDDLPGNDYVNFILLGLVELPGYVLIIPFMEKLGRKPALASTMILGGLSCIICAFVPRDFAKVLVGFALFGKLCVAAAFAVIYNYSAELFPTVVRHSATGLSSVLARIGSSLAPQVHLIGVFTATWVPNFIYGSVALLVGLLGCFLPETKGHPLNETIAEGVEFSKSMLSVKQCRRTVVPHDLEADWEKSEQREHRF